MKGSLLFLAFLYMINVHATIRTVSNTPTTLAQFNTIQAAINASVSGDTILVHGSPVIYNSSTITNKRLILLGPGFRPNIQSSFSAMITDITLTGSGCKKTEIQGFHFTTGPISVNTSMDSVYFYRNNILNINLVGGVGTINGFEFRSNYIRGQFTSHPASDFHNILFENNVFEAHNCINQLVNGANTNVLFNHNLFFAGNGIPGDLTPSISFVSFTNNIFVEKNFPSLVANCTFNNNLTFNCSPNNIWAVNGNIDGGGNIANMDPMMVDQAAVNDGSANEISNYTIASGPANNSGSDGKDIGLLYDATGGLNWAHARNCRLPSVVAMSITNPVLGAGGMLNVTVEARKNE